MTRARLCGYVGPPKGGWNTFWHYAVCVRTWSVYSHVELLIDGVCYSSSRRDGGVRGKQIDVGNGKWHTIALPLPDADIDRAKRWFDEREHWRYSWRGVARSLLPFIKQKPSEATCSQAVSEALGNSPKVAAAHTPADVMSWFRGANDTE